MHTELFIKMVTDAWFTNVKRMDNLLTQLSDEQWTKETAQGRNTGIYLVGHLAAVNDSMLVILGFGSKLYPQLEEIFLTSPDKSGKEMSTLADLKQYWHTINAKLAEHISALTPDEWFTKHSAVSEEDFAKEPHRNKLNILINRTNHLSYHIGQLIYLK